MSEKINYEKKLLNIFEEVGIFVIEDDYNNELELDSLQFVSVIIKIEEVFMIRVSADYEDFSLLKTFDDFRVLVGRYLC